MYHTVHNTIYGTAKFLLNKNQRLKLPQRDCAMRHVGKCVPCLARYTS